MGLIPVVYGSANYSRYLSPNSYVNVRDFTLVEGLANHFFKEPNIVLLIPCLAENSLITTGGEGM